MCTAVVGTDHEGEYPDLTRMARQFLGVPATSASAERLFLLAGVEYLDLRQQMAEGKLERILWARLNRKLDVPPRAKPQ